MDYWWIGTTRASDSAVPSRCCMVPACATRRIPPPPQAPQLTIPTRLGRGCADVGQRGPLENLLNHESPQAHEKSQTEKITPKKHTHHGFLHQKLGRDPPGTLLRNTKVIRFFLPMLALPSAMAEAKKKDSWPWPKASLTLRRKPHAGRASVLCCFQLCTFDVCEPRPRICRCRAARAA